MSDTPLDKTAVETEEVLESIDFKPEAGVVTAWGSRAFLFDVDSSLYVLREQMTREIGLDSAANIFYQSGFAAAPALVEFVEREVPTASGYEKLETALRHLSVSGYASLTLEGRRRRTGEVWIRAENSAEATLMRDREGRTGYACDYLRGLLRGLVEGLPPLPEFAAALECVETSCLANEDLECQFLVATPSHLTQHGYRQEGLSQTSVRETLLRLNRQLEEVLEAAKRDTLTGLFNRAHFETVLRHKIEHAKRRTDTLAVAMIDLDGFKEINDGMGHAMGDLALRQVGHLLGAQARDTDIVARYGGDEFAWLMPGTTVDAAVAVADRIRRLVQDIRAEMDLPISLSIGIATCPEDAPGMTDLIDFADIAMYQAKGAGGDQVRRYVAADQGRGAVKRRTQKPRLRLASGPAAEEDGLPLLDLGD